MAEHPEAPRVVGGVDTHKDLHVAAVVDHCDRVLGTESFPTTRHGYGLMLAWMRSFGVSSASGSNAPAVTVQGCCAICRRRVSKSWRSRRLIS